MPKKAAETETQEDPNEIPFPEDIMGDVEEPTERISLDFSDDKTEPEGEEEDTTAAKGEEPEDSEEGEEPEESEEGEEPEEGEESDKDDSPKEHMIPKSRLDQVLEKAKQKDEELRQMRAILERRKQAAPEGEDAPDLGQMELDYTNLLLDGEAEQATKLRMEIDEIKAQRVLSASTNETHSAQAERIANEAIMVWVNEYPVINEESDEFNAEIANDIVSMMQGLRHNGVSDIDAVNKSTETILRANGYIDGDASADSTPKPNTTVQEKIKAAKSQPPDLEGTGSSDTPDINIDEISEDEYMALPEKTRPRLRGDFL